MLIAFLVLQDATHIAYFILFSFHSGLLEWEQVDQDSNRLAQRVEIQTGSPGTPFWMHFPQEHVSSFLKV